MRATGETMVERAETGTVHLSYDGGVTWIEFCSQQAFHTAVEDIDRQVVVWDRDELDRWAEDRIEQDRANVRSLNAGIAGARRRHPTGRGT